MVKTPEQGPDQHDALAGSWRNWQESEAVSSEIEPERNQRELASATLYAICRDGAQMRFVASEHNEAELGSGGER